MGKNIKPYPSQCGSWLKCSAFCIATGNAERSSPNINQLEGLANHKIADEILVTDGNLESLMTRTISVKGFKLQVSREMITRVRGYIEHVREIRQHASHWGVETPVNILSVHKNYRGKIDYWQFTPNSKTLTVVDYKDGFGFVSPVENYTLSSYAIGLLDNFNFKVDHLEYHIFQPRISDKPRIFRCNLDLLKLHRDRLKHAYEKTVNGPHEETPGEHCKYCTARTRCIGFNNAVNCLYTVYIYSDDPGRDYDLNKRLNFLEYASVMINSSLTAEREVVEQNLKSGNQVEGWCLTPGRGGWSFKENVNVDEVKTLCEMFGVEAGRYKLQTPTQLKNKGIPEDFLENLTERKTGEMKIAKISPETMKNIFKD